MNIFRRLNQMSLSLFILSAITLVVYVVALFTAVNAEAQIPIFQQDYFDSASNVQIATGEPFYRNGRVYYYKQDHIVPANSNNDVKFYNGHDNRRFCSPGQRKKGQCRGQRYNREYKKYNHDYKGDRRDDNDGNWQRPY